MTIQDLINSAVSYKEEMAQRKLDIELKMQEDLECWSGSSIYPSVVQSWEKRISDVVAIIERECKNIESLEECLKLREGV